MKVRKEFLDELRDDIAALRDSSFHVCPVDQHQKLDYEEDCPRCMVVEEMICTCEEFDKVIDKITKVFEEYDRIKGVEEGFESISDMRGRAEEWRREAEFFVLYEVDKEEEARCYAQGDRIDEQADRLEDLTTLIRKNYTSINK